MGGWSPSLGMSVCFLVTAVPLAGCVSDWQEAGQGLGLLALGFEVCGVQRSATGRPAPWKLDG